MHPKWEEEKEEKEEKEEGEEEEGESARMVGREAKEEVGTPTEKKVADLRRKNWRRRRRRRSLDGDKQKRSKSMGKG